MVQSSINLKNIICHNPRKEQRMTNQETCEICGEGNASTLSELVESTYKNHKSDLLLHYKQCGTCGSDYAGRNECRTNRNILLEWRKEVDLLTKENQE